MRRFLYLCCCMACSPSGFMLCMLPAADSIPAVAAAPLHTSAALVQQRLHGLLMHLSLANKVVWPASGWVAQCSCQQDCCTGLGLLQVCNSASMIATATWKW